MEQAHFDKRIVELNDRPLSHSGRCIVYWMQKSQRATDNLALKFAAELANDVSCPLVVYFGLYEKYPMSSARAFQFMLEGLKETAAVLAEHGVGFLMRREAPAEGIVHAAKELGARAVVVDEDYLRTGRSWRSKAAAQLAVRLTQVDADTIVPARVTNKEEWGAYTIRPKILGALDQHLVDIPNTWPRLRWSADPGGCIDVTNSDPSELAAALDADQQVEPVSGVRGGLSQALNRLAGFVSHGLQTYADQRNDIGVECTSNLSPYLHFGQISPLRVALVVSRADVSDESVDPFLEQLIVRRELAINFCLHNDRYDSICGAANWARESLDRHSSDRRPEVYSLEELEAARTHDDLWNAAQTELFGYGKIHGYMRMVWAKKMLEWSESPQDALYRAIHLNDKYALDGRDPNGYANIAWCIYGKHDRPFPARPIFGMIRYMSTSATKRKTRWHDYVTRVSAPVRAIRSNS